MNRVLVISGSSGGKCRCGHRSKKGEVYVLIEGRKGNFSLCRECWVKSGLRGTKVTIEKMEKMWFGERSAMEVLCHA